MLDKKLSSSATVEECAEWARNYVAGQTTMEFAPKKYSRKGNAEEDETDTETAGETAECSTVRKASTFGDNDNDDDNDRNKKRRNNENEDDTGNLSDSGYQGGDRDDLENGNNKNSGNNGNGNNRGKDGKSNGKDGNSKSGQGLNDGDGGENNGHKKPPARKPGSMKTKGLWDKLDMDWIKSQIPFMHPDSKTHTFR